MKISENAWHLKWARFWHKVFYVTTPDYHIKWLRTSDYRPFREYEPKNLCQHFWAVILPPIFIPVTIPIFWFAALALTLLFGGLVAIIGTTTAPVWGPIWAVKSFKARQDPNREPSLVIAYIKARYRRICPLIEVVEE